MSIFLFQAVYLWLELSSEVSVNLHAFFATLNEQLEVAVYLINAEINKTNVPSP